MAFHPYPDDDPFSNHSMKWGYRSSGVRGQAVFNEITPLHRSTPVYYASVEDDGKYIVVGHAETSGKADTRGDAQRVVELFVEAEYIRLLEAEIAGVDEVKKAMQRRLRLAKAAANIREHGRLQPGEQGYTRSAT